MRTRSFWGILRTLLRREGADPMVAAMFYRDLVQAIIIYGSEMWLLFVAMESKFEGMHTGFLRQIT